MAKRWGRLVAAAASIGMATPQAEARSWPSGGGWDIDQLEGAGAMSLEYEGSGATRLHLVLDIDDAVMLGVSNYDWSIEVDREYELDFVLNGTVYGGGKAKGIKFDVIRPGFVTRMNEDFLRDFAAGNSLRIYRGETLVDQLSLEGTTAGLMVLRRCVAHVKAVATAEARDRVRLSHIPTDPFREPTPPSTDGPPPPGGPAAAAPPSQAFTSANAPTAVARHWVQIAGGADRRALDRELIRLKALAPELLSERRAWTTPLRFTHRLLVGPFETEAQAQEFAGGLAQVGIGAFAWKSEPGQEVVELEVR